MPLPALPENTRLLLRSADVCLPVPSWLASSDVRSRVRAARVFQSWLGGHVLAVGFLSTSDRLTRMRAPLSCPIPCRLSLQLEVTLPGVVGGFPIQTGFPTLLSLSLTHALSLSRRHPSRPFHRTAGCDSDAPRPCAFTSIREVHPSAPLKGNHHRDRAHP